MATPHLSAAGRAFVTGLAILANPRGFPGSKTVAFDTQLYLGPGDGDLMIGSLRFFNLKDLTFDDQANLYSIVTTVRALSLLFTSTDY